MNEAQHTLGWYRARLGNITGSMVGVIMKSGKSKTFSDTAESYLYDVLSDRTIDPDVINDDKRLESYLLRKNITTKQIQWGIEKENEARKYYELITGRKCVEVGSCRHKTVTFFASSPDGFTHDDESNISRCIEIKCPDPKQFVRYRQIETPEDLKKVKPEYYWQCMAHMACTGAQFTDFVTYDPDQQIKIHIVPITRDEAEITSMLDRVKLANEFINNTISKFTIF